jgi:MoxR-like ATPase
MCINKLDDARFISGKPSSGPGVLDVMFEETPKYMLIDELDDMDNDTQRVLGQYTETGIVDETKSGKTRRMKTNTKTFASANYPKNVLDAINDRFLDLHFDPYTKSEFREVCKHVLPKNEGSDPDEAVDIADAVWDIEGEGRVRKAIQVARLSRGDPEKVIGVLNDYDKSSTRGVFQ